MRTQLTALAAASIGLGAALTLLPTTATAGVSGTAHRAPTRTLTLTLRYADAQVHFVGKDASHPVIGDEFIDVVKIRQGSKVTGRATNICTIVSGTSEATMTNYCAGTYTLHNGELVTAGADGSSDTTTDAVTGGTGAYAYASGTAKTVSGAQAATVTIHYVVAR